MAGAYLYMASLFFTDLYPIWMVNFLIYGSLKMAFMFISLRNPNNNIDQSYVRYIFLQKQSKFGQLSLKYIERMVIKNIWNQWMCVDVVFTDDAKLSTFLCKSFLLNYWLYIICKVSHFWLCFFFFFVASLEHLVYIF